MKVEGLSELLLHLKDEVNQWTLEDQAEARDTSSADPDSAMSADLIRRGLFLTAMDILLSEMRRPGGYESYASLPDRIILPEQDYLPLRKALDPYVTWFRNLLIQHATRLAQSGVGEQEAFAQAVTSGTETLERLTLTTAAAPASPTSSTA